MWEGKVSGQGDGRGSRPLEESDHTIWESVVDPAPEDKRVQGNLAPSATYVGDMYNGGVNRMVARPRLDVKPGMRAGLEPEQAEDVAEDLPEAEGGRCARARCRARCR